MSPNAHPGGRKGDLGTRFLPLSPAFVAGYGDEQNQKITGGVYILGGKHAPVLVGFVAPVVALGTHGGKIYAGDLTGSVYSFTP
jgi:hypothetical protein